MAGHARIPVVVVAADLVGRILENIAHFIVGEVRVGGTQQRGNAMCTSLFEGHAIQALTDKMPVLPGRIPTREMLMINVVPTESETDALRSLEGAVRTCQLMRAAAGMPTSATEDIREQRASRLRYQLYSGTIPYGVYNYGLAKALKEQAQFMSASDGVFAQSASQKPMSAIAVPMDDGANWKCSQTSGRVSCR